MIQDPSTLILASSSPYRRELLSRLGLDFQCISPDIDETSLTDETPQALVTRLAQQKAEAIAKHHPHALIIGSDQVATLQGRIIGKPGDHDRAVDQLRHASGQKVTFYTGLCLYNSDSGHSQVICESFHVHFKTLDDQTIERYLNIEKPYNCAGSFKSEGLGIVLFERLEGDDPNALIGLPLIKLTEMMANEGLNIL